jgi:rubrerythrin
VVAAWFDVVVTRPKMIIFSTMFKNILYVVPYGGNFMPTFGTSFAGNNLDRKLSKDELIRAVRFDVAAEYEAVQFYVQQMAATDDKLTLAVLKDIAEEELKHAGQFLRLLQHLSPEDEKKLQHGYEETDNMLKKLKKK